MSCHAHDITFQTFMSRYFLKIFSLYSKPWFECIQHFFLQLMRKTKPWVFGLRFNFLFQLKNNYSQELATVTYFSMHFNEIFKKLWFFWWNVTFFLFVKIWWQLRPIEIHIETSRHIETSPHIETSHHIETSQHIETLFFKLLRLSQLSRGLCTECQDWESWICQDFRA